MAALDGVVFFPYSDFLLHDMGALGDGIVQSGAQGNEMRTAPLWGARVRTSFLHDGRVELDTNPVERAIRPVAVLESLCIPSSSVCKHCNRVVVSDATRATFSGYRRFDRFRRQVVGPNLVRRAGHNLHRGQHAGFDQAAYRVACGA